MTRVYHLPREWYRHIMPTDRRRYQITESPEVARAINAAAARWPGESRAKSVVRAISAGADALESESAAMERRAAIETLIGSGPSYPHGYLAGLRADWPE